MVLQGMYVFLFFIKGGLLQRRLSKF